MALEQEAAQQVGHLIICKQFARLLPARRVYQLAGEQTVLGGYFLGLASGSMPMIVQGTGGNINYPRLPVRSK